jgi:hypothetical protein
MGSNYELPDYYKDGGSDYEGEPEDSQPFSFWWVVLWLVVADIGTIFWLVS